MLLPMLAAIWALPSISPPSTSLIVELCAKSGSGLTARQVTSLTSRGFTKCCFGAFNVLVAGTADYPDAYMLTACVTVAELLDQDQDGVADDPNVVKHLSFTQAGENAPVAQGAPTQPQEARGDALGGDGFVYGFSLQTWKAFTAADAKSIITEEVFHMITQFGYSSAYPAELGMDSFTGSVACREMAAATCVHWYHPENTCPNPGTHTPPPLFGTCNDPNCDCVEWYHQVALILAGQSPGWYGNLMPRSKAALEATLSTAFKTMHADAKYHQLKKPLTYVYNAPPPPPTVTDSAAASPPPPDSAAASLGSGALGTMLLAVATTALLRGFLF